MATVAVWGLVGLEPERRPGRLLPATSATSSASSAAPQPELGASAPRTWSLPSGALPRFSCAEARTVAAFLRRELAAPPIAPTAQELGEAWSGMLDPHGLWSAAPDSPLQTELLAAAPEMLATLSGQSVLCSAAERVARGWMPWQQELVAIYDTALQAARQRPARNDRELFQLLADPIFEEDPVTTPARELSRKLGERLGAFVARYPEQAELADWGRSRFFPRDRDTLVDVALLAALRAYVPLVDPHGDFAANDEQWALLSGDTTLDPGSALWGEMSRTPLGARVTDAPTAPLEMDDLIVSINGFVLAGATLDQIEQAARSADKDGSFALRVLRQGEGQLLSLRVELGTTEPSEGLEVERIPFGNQGQAILRVAVADVGDGLSHELAEVLEQDAADVSALLLDLRGNGGGSLNAAVESLGLLLPGVKLFPLIHRGRVVEVLEAGQPQYTYRGPVAALVDGDTASAAEMLAGAIQAYERGTIVGARTFGKGCVQEYFDDVVASGVLRLTTLQFVMPSGQPLQQIGLTPDVVLPLAPALERESDITRQPITFDGPDVRGRPIAAWPAWPRETSRPGPCRDAWVCTAISRLAGVRPGSRAGGRAAQRRPTTR